MFNTLKNNPTIPAPVQKVISDLELFEPTHDGVNNVLRLYSIFDGFCSLPGRELACPAIFSLIERFPEAPLGEPGPGPLVNELEATPGYERLLRDSLHRQPTNLTVWMVNRLLNSSRDKSMWEIWMVELAAVLRHPYARESTKESVRVFLEYQDKDQAEPYLPNSFYLNYSN